MDVSSNNYLTSSSDPRLIDHIVYELKSQGIFDKFRKECIADVDTKPAYQNLRQRVEGSVTGFLKTQRWRPDMNKNQVRESLRRTISESGFLEIGVERIVDQVVNPKINSIFLPQVESVVYKYMGVQKPSAMKSESDSKSNDINNLLPNDLEAVSPEPTECVNDDSIKVEDPVDDKKVEEKIDEDESPPFEPLGEPSFLIQEDTVDSHMSGFSGLASHDSNHSTDVVTKLTTILETSNSESQPQLLQQTSEDNSVSVSNENSNSKSDSVSTKVESSKKSDDKSKDDRKGSDKHRSSSKHKSRHDSKDKRSSYDKSKDRSRRHSSRDDDKKYRKDDRDRKDDKDKKDDRDKKDDKDKRDDKDKKDDRDKERSRTSSSNSKYSSSRKSSSKSESKSDSKSRHDDKYKSKSRKDDKHHKSSSSSSNKDVKKDDHYSLKDKKTTRRSTDRDSSDGHSGTQSSSSSFTESVNSQKSNKNVTCVNSTGESSNSEQVDGENQTKTVGKMEKLFLKYKGKPKFASNIYEAKKLMKIRKMWGEIEKEREAQNKKNSLKEEAVLNDTKSVVEDSKLSVVIGTGPVISKETWDAMEAKANAENAISMTTDYCCFSDLSEEKIQVVESSFTTEDDFKGFTPNPRKERFQETIGPIMDELETSITKQSHLLQGTKNHANDALPKVAFVKLQESEIVITPSMKHEASPDFRNNNNKTKLFDKDSDDDFKSSLPKAKRARIDKSANHSINLDGSVGDDGGEKLKQGGGTTKAGHNLRNQQRYSSDDLYKPRLQFTSRRRTAKSNN